MLIANDWVILVAPGAAVYQRLDPVAKAMALDAFEVPRARRAGVLRDLSIIESAALPVLNRVD
ncbi:MAG: hypothetical protein FWD77_04510 [Betaproteobacteria bacterium]|nr:hypothetical protein [Betaproteobacteria bacterium]